VKTAREFGDLSENFEYKAAKREKIRNDSRIRYLERMIRTAKIISVRSEGEAVGLFDKLEIYMEDEGEVREVQIVTTLRQNALEGRISKESPVGKALLGRKAGDRVCVEMDSGESYYIVIRSVQRGEDSESLPISEY
jgi:transcription elongation factor GreA